MKILLIPLLLLPMIVFAKTYPIVEPDAMQELKSRAGALNIEAERKAIYGDIISNRGVILSKAEDNATRIIDPTFTLDRDIPEVDSAGKIKRILYPKGYKFNPVDYAIILPPPLVVFNACDTAERTFAEEFISTEPHSIFVSTNCPLEQIKNIGETPVYLLTQSMADRFQLRHSVSIIRVNKAKRGIEVNEIAIDNNTVPADNLPR
jgi:conjugal transfer pilus assembly protein TraW